MELKYTLTRSRRKSIGIAVRDGAVYVRAPLKTSVSTIEKFISEKEEWINKKLAQNEERKSRYADVLAYDSFLYLGKRMNIVPTDKKSVSVSDGEIFIPKVYCPSPDSLHEKKFKASLKRAYVKTAEIFLADRLREASGFSGLKYNGFSLTNARRKWGSCDGENNIKLNWRLVLLERGLIDYVIVHELAHTVHHNHSRAFWDTVARIYPQYKQAIVCLKERGLLTQYL